MALDPLPQQRLAIEAPLGPVLVQVGVAAIGGGGHFKAAINVSTAAAVTFRLAPSQGPGG